MAKQEYKQPNPNTTLWKEELTEVWVLRHFGTRSDCLGEVVASSCPKEGQVVTVVRHGQLTPGFFPLAVMTAVPASVDPKRLDIDHLYTAVRRFSDAEEATWRLTGKLRL